MKEVFSIIKILAGQGKDDLLVKEVIHIEQDFFRRHGIRKREIFVWRLSND